jgi:hypothetical protein
VEHSVVLSRVEVGETARVRAPARVEPALFCPFWPTSRHLSGGAHRGV